MAFVFTSFALIFFLRPWQLVFLSWTRRRTCAVNFKRVCAFELFAGTWEHLVNGRERGVMTRIGQDRDGKGFDGVGFLSRVYAFNDRHGFP